jgi:hypothetical protein
MSLILLMVILVVLLGGGGAFYGSRAWDHESSRRRQRCPSRRLGACGKLCAYAVS